MVADGLMRCKDMDMVPGEAARLWVVAVLARAPGGFRGWRVRAPADMTARTLLLNLHQQVRAWERLANAHVAPDSLAACDVGLVSPDPPDEARRQTWVAVRYGDTSHGRLGALFERCEAESECQTGYEVLGRLAHRLSERRATVDQARVWHWRGLAVPCGQVEPSRSMVTAQWRDIRRPLQASVLARALAVEPADVRQWIRDGVVADVTAAAGGKEPLVSGEDAVLHLERAMNELCRRRCDIPVQEALDVTGISKGALLDWIGHRRIRWSRRLYEDLERDAQLYVDWQSLIRHLERAEDRILPRTA